MDLEILKYKFIYCDCAGGSLGPEGSLVVVCGLSCPVARGMLVLWPGSELAAPVLEDEFLTPGPSGKSLEKLF